MDQIVDQIRAALVPGASPETRVAGAIACRAALAALEASDTTPDNTAPSASSESHRGAVALLAQLGRIPPDQRIDLALDVAIARLGAMLPADAPPIEVRSPRFPLVPLGAHVSPGGAR